MTDERQQIHWQDCYKDRHHHACALVEIDRLRAEVQHWKANHDNRVEAARVLIERNDLPFDRVPAYKHYLHLQEDVAALRAENESLRKVLTIARDTLVEVLAAERFSSRPPETVMLAELKLDRIRKRKASKLADDTIAMLNSTIDAAIRE